MRHDEFAGYLAYFVPDYAAEISTNYDMDIDAATARAEAEAASSLPQGPETAGQVLLCLVDAEDAAEVLGYLWCAPNAEARSVFIYDFYVAPEHRGKGYGRAALGALEEMFAGPDYGEIKLRVAADNPGARRLYEAAGYQVTGINMRKALPG
jgi:ribosomal protein S18 acetylase RimI-like enzyme